MRRTSYWLYKRSTILAQPNHAGNSQRYWLGIDFSNTNHLNNALTIFFSSDLGVSGFVVNDKNQLLVIQEKYHPGSAKPRWKLPGGHARKGGFFK